MVTRDTIRNALINSEEFEEVHVKCFDSLIALWAFLDYPLTGSHGEIRVPVYLVKQYLHEATGTEKPWTALHDLRTVELVEPLKGEPYIASGPKRNWKFRDVCSVGGLFGYSSSERNVPEHGGKPTGPGGYSRLCITFTEAVTRAFLPSDREIIPSPVTCIELENHYP